MPFDGWHSWQGVYRTKYFEISGKNTSSFSAETKPIPPNATRISFSIIAAQQRPPAQDGEPAIVTITTSSFALSIGCR